MVDNLIASVFVLFKHLTNVNAMLPVQLFLFLIIRFVLGLQLSYRLIIQLATQWTVKTVVRQFGTDDTSPTSWNMSTILEAVLRLHFQSLASFTSEIANCPGVRSTEYSYMPKT